MKVSVNLDSILKKKGLTAKELAEKAGISTQQLSSIRTGQSKGITFNTLALLLEFLRCEPNDLFLVIKDENKSND